MKYSILNISACLLLSISAIAQKPILPDFAADPTARVFKNQVYIYPTHDIPGNTDWNTYDFHTYSSKDLIHWKDHGIVFSVNDVSWGKQRLWAPDCVYANGKYYLYFAADFQIGVAVSKSPTGPFKDPLGKPLITKRQGGTNAIDQCVFIDDDGQAYIYWGQNTLCVSKLNKDMTSLEGEIMHIPVHNYHEGIFVHKKDSLYYFSHPSNKGDKVANLLEYSTAKSPLGPFKYRGIIMDNRSRNVHHSFFKFKGKWYLAYHVQGPSPYERRVCLENVTYNANGTIQPIKMTAEGVVAK